MTHSSANFASLKLAPGKLVLGAGVCFTLALGGTAFGQTAGNIAERSPSSMPDAEMAESLTDRAVQLPDVASDETPQIDFDAFNRRLRSQTPERFAEGFGTVTRGGVRSEVTEERREQAIESYRTFLERIDEPNTRGSLRGGDRLIIGTDDRAEIFDSSAFPFRTVSLLLSSDDPNGENYSGTCTGTLIGPRAVLTAAHCVYDHETPDGWLPIVDVAPGAVGGDAPYGVYETVDATIPSGYIDFYEGFYGSVAEYDVAVLELAEPVGESLGWMGYGYQEPLQDFMGNVVGYPGDKDLATMWRSACMFEQGNVEGRLVFHYCDLAPGNSGSSVYRYNSAENERLILAVYIASADAEGFQVALRLDEAYFNLVKDVKDAM